MKHQWKTTGPDSICRHCAKLRSGSNDDQEDCAAGERALGDDDDLDIEKLDQLAKQIEQADREDDAPVQFQINVLRRQLLELVGIMKGEG